MHFLGLSGQPRRILDYPDVFVNYNTIISLGSFLSFTSIFAFLLALYNSNHYIIHNLSSASLEDAVIVNKYYHLHNFNSIPAINILFIYINK
jgi:heme/copper-type cytochrome/quinol oxidase subunit 1